MVLYQTICPSPHHLLVQMRIRISDWSWTSLRAQRLTQAQTLIHPWATSSTTSCLAWLMTSLATPIRTLILTTPLPQRHLARLLM